jgi:hypothetical protein
MRENSSDCLCKETTSPKRDLPWLRKMLDTLFLSNTLDIQLSALEALDGVEVTYKELKQVDLKTAVDSLTPRLLDGCRENHLALLIWRRVSLIGGPGFSKEVIVTVRLSK